jgi:hypothetical protein
MRRSATILPVLVGLGVAALTICPTQAREAGHAEGMVVHHVIRQPRIALWAEEHRRAAERRRHRDEHVAALRRTQDR